MNLNDLHLWDSLASSDFEGLYQAFSAVSDLHHFSQQILDLASHMTGAENCSLMLLNGRGELYVLNARGIDQNAARTFRTRIGEGIAGQVVQEGKPLIVEDISKDERFAMYRRERYRTGSFIACPITSHEKVVGVLNVNDKKNGVPFDNRDLDQAKLVAVIAAIALRSFLGESRAQLKQGELDEVLRRLQDAERQQRELIARLSHDLRTPLNSIKGAIYYLQRQAGTQPAGDSHEFYEIIEREVNYLISCVDDGFRRLEQEHLRLFSQDSLERVRKLI